MEKTENKELILSKKLYAQKLLKEGKSFTQVQKTVKIKFKTDFSNRDLVKIKASIINIPEDRKLYSDAFEVCYSVLCNLREKNPQAQSVVDKYANLFFDLEKKRVLDLSPKI